MTKGKIVELAKEFCSKNRIADYPVHIVDLCKQYGIDVFEKYLTPGVSGFIVIQEENFKDYGSNHVIVANLHDSASRRRFTIAHELAHFILHKKPDEALFAHRDAGQTNYMEYEANTFAANILMPEDLVKDVLSQIESEDGELFISTKIRCVSDAFAVSTAAARVRLEQLKMI